MKQYLCRERMHILSGFDRRYINKCIFDIRNSIINWNSIIIDIVQFYVALLISCILLGDVFDGTHSTLTTDSL